MDSQRLQDHLRDEADARKDTTLGDMLREAADTFDMLEGEASDADAEIEQLKEELAGLKARFSNELTA